MRFNFCKSNETGIRAGKCGMGRSMTLNIEFTEMYKDNSNRYYEYN